MSPPSVLRLGKARRRPPFPKPLPPAQPLQQLAQWKEQLAKPRSGSRSEPSVRRRVDRLLSGQHLSEVLRIEYDAHRQGGDRLEYWVDEAALRHREGLTALLGLLGSIRLALMLHPSGKKGGRPRADWQLEVADQDIADLFHALVPDKPPFVYTDGSA